jgi:hypothetical protein
MTVDFTTFDFGGLADIMLLYVSIVVTYNMVKTQKAVHTKSGMPLGQEIDSLKEEFAQIADSKLLADARLASAALVAVAKLAREAKEDSNLLVEAQRAAEQIIVEADKAAVRLESDKNVEKKGTGK